MPAPTTVATDGANTTGTAETNGAVRDRDRDDDHHRAGHPTLGPLGPADGDGRRWFPPTSGPAARADPAATAGRNSTPGSGRTRSGTPRRAAEKRVMVGAADPHDLTASPTRRS